MRNTPPGITATRYIFTLEPPFAFDVHRTYLYGMFYVPQNIEVDVTATENYAKRGVELSVRAQLNNPTRSSLSWDRSGFTRPYAWEYPDQQVFYPHSPYDIVLDQQGRRKRTPNDMVPRRKLCKTAQARLPKDQRKSEVYHLLHNHDYLRGAHLWSLRCGVFKLMSACLRVAKEAILDSVSQYRSVTHTYPYEDFWFINTAGYKGDFSEND